MKLPIRQWLRLRNAGALLSLVLCLFCANAHASIYTVTNLSDSGTGSLRAAISLANSNSGSTIIFNSSLSGAITLASALPDITASMTISGPSTGAVAISGANSYRPFNVPDGGPVTLAISYLTIQNGVASAGGGLSNFNSSGSVTLTNCVFSHNYSSYVGGAIYNGANLTMSNCTLTYNSAQNAGGGIHDYAFGILTMTNCVLTGNYCTSQPGVGGAICVYNANSALYMTNCWLTENGVPPTYGVPGYGGGISNAYGLMTLTGCTLAGNGGDGFGINCPLTLTNDILYDNGMSFPSSGISVNYCDIKQSSGVFPGTGNINVDPLFVRAPSAHYPGTLDFGDLHLQTGSPCIAAGTYLSSDPTDFDGVTRNNPPSIGAYEL